MAGFSTLHAHAGNQRWHWVFHHQADYQCIAHRDGYHWLPTSYLSGEPHENCLVTIYVVKIFMFSHYLFVSSHQCI